MRLTHKIRINVAEDDGEKETVLEGGICRLPTRLLRFFFGDMAEVMVLKPGNTVDSVEIFRHQSKTWTDSG